MAESSEAFSVMVKPVGSRCNMRCRYCYYLEKGRYSTNEKQYRMTDELLEELIRRTVETCPGDVISFVWHGGEPTLAGIDFYRRAVELEMKYLPPGKQIWNNLQTNGYAISDEWCGFLKEYGFDVGVSIDGTAEVHDANRRTASGKATHGRVRENIHKLVGHGIRVDLLCTVNSASLTDPVGVYRSLRDLDTGWIQFIPIVVRTPEGISPESVTPEGYGDFLVKVFDEWVTSDLGRCDVQLFAEMARIKAGGKPSLCWMAETCGRALIAEEDGGIYACDHFVDTEHRRGTLLKDDFLKMADGPEQRAFGAAKRDSISEDCLSCPWRVYCNGGCPKDRFGTDSTGKDCRYFLCEGLRMLFSHADGMLQKVMELSAKGMKPDAIMKKLKRI